MRRPPSSGAAIISAPAFGSNGNLYYTVNLSTSVGMDSTLVCAHDTRLVAPNHLYWRFRLPYTGEADFPDADGISYGPLSGFQFQGAPVVDAQGNVFALAVNGSQTAILCFNGTQSITVQAVPPATVPPGDTVSVDRHDTVDPRRRHGRVRRHPAQNIAAGAQFNATPDSSGYVTLYNFGAQSTAVTGPTVSPNVSEPQPVTVAYTPELRPRGAVRRPRSTQPRRCIPTWLWYALLPDAPSPSTGVAPDLRHDAGRQLPVLRRRATATCTACTPTRRSPAWSAATGP